MRTREERIIGAIQAILRPSPGEKVARDASEVALPKEKLAGDVSPALISAFLDRLQEKTGGLQLLEHELNAMTAKIGEVLREKCTRDDRLESKLAAAGLTALLSYYDKSPGEKLAYLQGRLCSRIQA